MKPATEEYLQHLQNDGLTVRRMPVQPKTYDKTKRSVNVIASTETPVEVFDWERWEIVREVLLSKGFSLRSGDQAPLLDSHSRYSVSDILGSARNWRSDNGQVEAELFFAKGERAEDAEGKLSDGHLTDVSVGYRAIDATYIPKGEKQIIEGRTYEGPMRVTTEWRIHELSLVPIGADELAKVRDNRSPAINRTETTNTSKGGTTMGDQNKDQGGQEVTQKVEVAVRELERKPLTAEQKEQNEAERKEEITAISKRYVDRVSNVDKIAKDAISLGISVDQFRSDVYTRITDTEPLDSSGDIGMTRKQVQQFSFMRLLRAISDPKNKQAQEAAAFEFECSEAARKTKENARGVATIPNDVIMHSHRRDLLSGTGSLGGNLVATDLMGFIDVLRANMVFQSLGSVYLTGLQGNLALPGQSAATTAYWVAENAAPTEGAPTYNQVALSPKTVGAYVDIGRRLMIQSSVDIEGVVRNDLARGLALAIEAAAINGTSTSNQPNGILNISGVGTTTGGANGLAPTWANILELETDVAAGNAEMGSIAYLTNPNVRGKLKNTLKSTAVVEGFVWDSRAGSDPVNGYRTAITTQVPNNLTKGTSTAICSAIIYGNFAECVFGIWGNGVDLLVDPYTGSAAGTTRVRALADVDFNLRHPVSFSFMPDALTT